jgi:hypothetical protein
MDKQISLALSSEKKKAKAHASPTRARKQSAFEGVEIYNQQKTHQALGDTGLGSK